MLLLIKQFSQGSYYLLTKNLGLGYQNHTVEAIRLSSGP